MLHHIKKELTIHFKAIVKTLTSNVKNSKNLVNTPKRASMAMIAHLKGYNDNLDNIIRGALFDSEFKNMVLVKDIEFYSLCEHHLLPFFGKCHVAYIPNGKVIGLSKIPRIVEMFSRRLQIQENLTLQIAQCLLDSTQASGVAIAMQGRHLCVNMRGVKQSNVHVSTYSMLGCFENNLAMREQFYRAIQ